MVLFLFGHLRDFYRKKIYGGRSAIKEKEGYAPIRQDYEVGLMLLLLLSCQCCHTWVQSAVSGLAHLSATDEAAMRWRVSRCMLLEHATCAGGALQLHRAA